MAHTPDPAGKRHVMRTWLTVLLVCLGAAAPALASRPVSDEERAKIEEALKALGCSGREVSFDDHRFEVDRAACVDARLYDFDFDRRFKLIKTRQD